MGIILKAPKWAAIRALRGEKSENEAKNGKKHAVISVIAKLSEKDNRNNEVLTTS